MQNSEVATLQDLQHPQGAGREIFASFLFILRRLLLAAAALPAIAFLSFVGLAMARGAAFRPSLEAALFKTPVYLARLLTGDPGLTAPGSISLRPVPVLEFAPQALLRSGGLLAVALLFALLIGVSLGLWAAARRHSGRSLLILIVSILGISLPSFFTALILQRAALNWSKATGVSLVPVGGFGWDAHLILPALVLSARPIAQIFRITFLGISNVLDQDFVRIARNKGLNPRLVIWRHVLRNVAIPILTTLGVSLRFSLSSLPVVELFFGWTGAGLTLLKAISRQDENLTLFLVLSFGLLIILVNLLLETSYPIIDPRLRGGTDIRAGRSRRANFRFSDFFAEVREWLERLPLLRRNRSRSKLDVERRTEADADEAELYRRARRRAWLAGTARNGPLLVGSLILISLAVVYFAGPRLAPYSPYTTLGLEYVDGQFLIPPFPPDSVYPLGTDALGRDMLSLILTGAQQTLLLALMVVAVRLAVGLVLGALAGWTHGSLLDRVIVGASEMLAAFPTLLLAMILILALGIRQGISTFILALSVVGWGEIMHYVRAETIAIRPRPFIESAIAIGLRTPRLLVGHLLPNLVPALISLAALEMGAVLMLLGELGFIGIFIGGGAFAELDIGAAPYHYSDVPEWGSLLASIRSYAQGYPWMAIYPSIAFFLAILGFNLTGEGLRRMIETVGITLNRIVNRYTFGLAILVLLGWGWIRDYTGAAAIYREQAIQFRGPEAFEDLTRFVSPEFGGRELGSAGLVSAADWLTERFKDAGLQPAGETLTFRQSRTRSYEKLTQLPQLSIDSENALQYGRDFAEFPTFFRNLGQASGTVRLFLAGDLRTVGSFNGLTVPTLQGEDFSGEILMVLDPSSVSYLRRLPVEGILVVADDESEMRRRRTLSTLDPTFNTLPSARAGGQDLPVLWISSETANRLLAREDLDVSQAQRRADALDPETFETLALDTSASMLVEGEIVEGAPTAHVAGYIPGSSGTVPGGGEALDRKMIVVLAAYDMPPEHPDGRQLPGAGENGAGVALLLEAVRTMERSGYRPAKSMLFIAYSGEGLEGGRRVNQPEADVFLQSKYGFAGTFEVETVIRLQGLGGSGELQIDTGGNLRLASLFEQAARQMGVSLKRMREPVDFSSLFEERSSFSSGQEAPEATLSRSGWQEIARTEADQVDAISAESLEEAGRVLTQVLMVLGREVNY